VTSSLQTFTFTKIYVLYDFLFYFFSEENTPYPDTGGYILKLTLAIIGPVIALGVIGTIVLVFMRRSHKNRLARQNGLWNKERQNGTEPEGYYTDELVHVTAPGDTTLRVSVAKTPLKTVVYRSSLNKTDCKYSQEFWRFTIQFAVVCFENITKLPDTLRRHAPRANCYSFS